MTREDALVPGRARCVALLAVAVLVLGACGDDGAGDTTARSDTEADTDTDDMSDEHADDDADHDAGDFEFGEPADAADADRVVEIEARDDLTFDPAAVTVHADEVVTFRVTNVGVLPHDFTLGDEQLQEQHDAEMARMSPDDMAMHDEANAFVLQPGTTKEMTWHLTEPGELIFGCHTPGHYAAGMHGTVTVEG